MATQVTESACTVKVDGSELSAQLMEGLIEVKVQENVMLPAVATVRLVASDFTDPTSSVDSSPLKIGKSLEVLLGGSGESSAASVFKGVIVSEEAEFGEKHAEVHVRAYDRAHRLNRERKNRTFQDMNAEDIVTKVAADHGLSPQIETSGSLPPFKHIEQSGQTDWELVWRFAQMYDMELQCSDQKLVFRDADKEVGSEVRLTYTDQLMSFRPRVTGAGTVEKVNVRGWDPKTKQAIVGVGTKGDIKKRGNPPASNGNLAVDTGANGDGTLVSDLSPLTKDEATALAKSTVSRLGGSAVEAEGTAQGSPLLRAGTKVKIEGVGTRFSGSYRLSAVTHIYRASGYHTQFAISGAAARGLLDLMRPKPRRNWGDQLVIGVVTQNSEDPDGMGRVRVKVPALSDTEEAWWARVVTPSAGAGHGIYTLPALGDEVILGFENGDTRRPYVLGSLFNGKDKPASNAISGQDSGKHGNYVVNSGEKLLTHSVKETEIKSDKPMLLESKDTMTVKSEKDQTVKSAQKITIEAGSSITIKGTGSVNVESSASVTVKGGSSVSVEASGTLTLKGSSVSIN